MDVAKEAEMDAAKEAEMDVSKDSTKDSTKDSVKESFDGFIKPPFMAPKPKRQNSKPKPEAKLKVKEEDVSADEQNTTSIISLEVSRGAIGHISRLSGLVFWVNAIIYFVYEQKFALL